MDRFLKKAPKPNGSNGNPSKPQQSPKNQSISKKFGAANGAKVSPTQKKDFSNFFKPKTQTESKDTSPKESKKEPLNIFEKKPLNESNISPAKQTEKRKEIADLPDKKVNGTNENEATNGVSPKRRKISSSDATNRFMFSDQDSASQFFNLYSSRLAEMTELLKNKVQQKWGSEHPIKKLCELREDETSECIIIGTIFKHQQLKPSILREISEENQLAPQPPRTYFVSDNDKLILEDELQRIRLVGKFDVHKVVTGVVCAVKGYVESDGKFEVQDIIFYESGPQRPLKPLTNSSFLVLISGFDQSTSANKKPVESLQKWLNKKENVTRVIFAGNSIRANAEAKLKSLQTKSADCADTVKDVKDLDKWISESLSNLSVDLMPGEYDPANYMLPQQPFHQCMFPLSARQDGFRSTTNPCELELNGRIILGTSGQNIADIKRTSKIEDDLEAASNIIKWGHLAPTCPDTLACYPYVNRDPFIIRDCPHLYFTGNMDAFQTTVFEGLDSQKVRVVCVPSFHKTQSIVAVDLNSLECEEICFKEKN